nr:hypothetical protein [Actinomyces sp.]
MLAHSPRRPRRAHADHGSPLQDAGHVVRARSSWLPAKPSLLPASQAPAW